MNTITVDEKLPFVLLTVGECVRQLPVVRDPGPVSNQFIWVKQGRGVFTVGQDTFELRAGEGVFMRHDHPHRYEGDHLHTGWCTFTSSESLLHYTIGDRSHLIFKVPDFLERETEELCRLAQSNCSTLALSAAGYAYVCDLFSAITRTKDDLIDSVKDYMKRNLTRTLTLEEIAAAVGMSKFALCHYFQKHQQRSVMEELKRLRISHAKRLLLYSSYGVEQIGRMCGFDSHSYFSLRFRELCGCTPLEYRKKHQ